MAASAGPALKELHARHGDRIEFVTLYVREAHPGARIPQPQTLEQKLANASAYQQRDDISWPVAVDDLDGTVHNALGRMPDMAYVIDRCGRVAGRVLWSNDAAGLERIVRAVVEGRRPHRAVRYASLAPLVRGLGATSPVLDAAGRSAHHDMLVTAPPIYVLARLASLFRPLSPSARGLAAITLAAAATIAAGTLARRIRR